MPPAICIFNINICNIRRRVSRRDSRLKYCFLRKTAGLPQNTAINFNKDADFGKHNGQDKPQSEENFRYAGNVAKETRNVSFKLSVKLGLYKALRYCGLGFYDLLYQIQQIQLNINNETSSH